MKGNEAIGEAAIQVGCRLYFAYPITPQSEVAEYLSRRMPEVGGTFLQAESELGASNMVFGAAATGEMASAGSCRPSRTTSRPPRAAVTGTIGCSSSPPRRCRRRWT